MSVSIFDETETDFCMLTYDVDLLKDSHFGDMIDEVVEELRVITERDELTDRPERVFDYILQDPGQLQLKFRNTLPLRVATIWCNRLEKKLKDLYLGENAA